nr:putative ORF1 [Marmot picobirnavirus]
MVLHTTLKTKTSKMIKSNSGSLAYALVVGKANTENIEKGGNLNLTKNQIEYFKAVNQKNYWDAALSETSRSNRANERITSLRDAETKRSNLAREKETNRSNVAKENENTRSNQAREIENFRSNLARETETQRSNLARESEASLHNRVSENETMRHNLATESETSRTNRVNESIKSSNISLGYSQLSELSRANKANELERNRSNVASELIRMRGNDIQSDSNSIAWNKIKRQFGLSTEQLDLAKDQFALEVDKWDVNKIVSYAELANKLATALSKSVGTAKSVLDLANY